MWDTTRAHLRVDGRATRALAGRWLTRRTVTGLDGMLGDAGSGNNTLFRAVHTNAESPSIVIFVEHADKLTSVKLKFVLHGRSKIHLDTMDVVRHGDWWRTGGGWARRFGDIVSPGWAWGHAIVVVETWWREILFVERWQRAMDRSSSDDWSRTWETIHSRIAD